MTLSRFIGSCVFYLVHPDTKKLMEVTFYVEMNDGSVWPNTTKDKKTKATLHVQKQEVIAQTVAPQMPKPRNEAPKLITSKDQILCEHPDVFDGIDNFPWPSYHIQIDPSVTFKQTPHCPILVHLKEVFKQEIKKTLQAGVLAPFNETTPWINSFVLVESKNKLGNLKFAFARTQPT